MGIRLSRILKNQSWDARLLVGGSLLLLIVSPLFTPLAVWLSTIVGHFDAIKIVKEVLLTAMGVLLIAVLLARKAKAYKVLADPLLRLMIAYAVYVLLYGAYDLLTGRVSSGAVIFGWLVDLRPVVFFGIVYSAVRLFPDVQSYNWRRPVLLVAALVIVFGLLQMFVLPADVLKYVGYSETTITPVQLVDRQADFPRVQSSLRGPNPFGAYLVVIAGLVLPLLVAANGKRRNWLVVGFLGLLVVMYGTYSRSALVGLVLTLGVLMAVWLRKTLGLKRVAMAGLAVILIGASGIYVMRDNDLVQNVVFHSSESSAAVSSSNADRASALQKGVRGVFESPLGTGVGSSGPASFHNYKNPPELSENYYLQIAKEIGLLGMGAFIAIQIWIAYRLYKLRNDAMSVGLLASLLGLVFIALVSHVWTDDTLAYTWWGLAAVAVARGVDLNPVKSSAILSAKRKHYEKATKKSAPRTH